DVMEGCSNRELMGKKGAGLRGVNQAMSEPFIFRYPSNLYMQFGDYPARFAQGSPSKFTYFGSGAGGYDPAHLGRGGTLRRLVSEDASSSLSGSCSGHQSDPSCDVF